MKNIKLIDETVKMVSDYFEAEGIHESAATIREQALDWYDHSEIVEAEMLSAAVMSYGFYKPGLKWRELENLRDFYFGYFEDNFTIGEREDLYSIGEIEDAQRDAMWQ